MSDPTKPSGDACCEGDTLKDASKMDWPDSPSELEPLGVGDKRKYKSEESDSDGALPTYKAKVSLLYFYVYFAFC